LNKKVLYVATVAKKHICQFHLPYLKWFKEHGYETHVCAGNDFEADDVKSIPYCDKFHEICFSRSLLSTDHIKAYKQLKKYIDENDFDIIHCHTPIAAAITRLAASKARNNGAKVIYTSHGFHFFKGAPKSSLLYYFTEKFLVPFTDAIITVNAEDYNAAKKFCKNKTCEPFYIHGMGVDTEKIKNTVVDKAELKRKLGLPEDAFVLLSVSEQNYNKNLTTTLRAFSQIEDPNMYYVICGTGNMLETHKVLAQVYGVGDRVIFTGYRYDIYEIVHIADIFLFSSLREGLGFAPIEAMSAGVPIIASNIRGVTEYAVDGENSILLSPCDIDGFAEAIKTLSADPERRHEMGRKAAEAVVPFDLKKSISSMEAIYGRYLSDIKNTEAEEISESDGSAELNIKAVAS